eukprot:3892543-Amphidinium_carterae.1
MEMCLPPKGLETQETELPRHQEKTRRVVRQQKWQTWPLTLQTSKAARGLPAWVPLGVPAESNHTLSSQTSLGTASCSAGQRESTAHAFFSTSCIG